MLFQRHGPPDADRLLVVLSDIEMGAGGPTDDFPHSEWLGDLVRSYQSALYAELQVDFVFNGDTFDLLKTSYEGKFPHHIDAKVALGKMERIIAAHQPFFEALREALAAPGPERRAWFVVGNHDLEILFPEVQTRIAKELGTSSRVHFPGFSLRIGDVLIEHGQQTDDLFRTDPTRPFVDYQGRAILNLSWAAVSLLEVAMPMHPVFYHLDRLKPREMVFRLMPEVRDLLVDVYWQYWVQRGWGWVTGDDPLKQVHWNVVKEVIYRFGSNDGDVYAGGDFAGRMQHDELVRLYLVGHEHRAGWQTWGDRKVLRTGAFREEYMLEDDGLVLRRIPKVYAEAWLRSNQVLMSELVEVRAPALPDGYAPDSIFDVLADVRRMTRPSAETAGARREREALEAKAKE